MACAAAIFEKCPNICVITFNLHCSTYMLLEWRVMLYFNVIILLPCLSHLLNVLGCPCKNVHNGRTWFLYGLLWDTTCLERPLLLCRRGGRPRQVLLYSCWTIGPSTIKHCSWLSQYNHWTLGPSTKHCSWLSQYNHWTLGPSTKHCSWLSQYNHWTLGPSTKHCSWLSQYSCWSMGYTNPKSRALTRMKSCRLEQT